jgi:hypothetical protein
MTNEQLARGAELQKLIKSCEDILEFLEMVGKPLVDGLGNDIGTYAAVCIVGRVNAGGQWLATSQQGIDIPEAGLIEITRNYRKRLEAYKAEFENL